MAIPRAQTTMSGINWRPLTKQIDLCEASNLLTYKWMVLILHVGMREAAKVCQGRPPTSILR